MKNGTLGTLARIEGGHLTGRLDGPDGVGMEREVVFGLVDYADIGHGCAATIRKSAESDAKRPPIPTQAGRLFRLERTLRQLREKARRGIDNLVSLSSMPPNTQLPSRGTQAIT